MFGSLYEWLKDLSFYLILVTAVLYVLPSNSYRKYLRFFTGLVLIVLLITPVLNLFGMKPSVGESLMEEFEDEYKNQIGQFEKRIKEPEIINSVPIEVEEIVIEP